VVTIKGHSYRLRGHTITKQIVKEQQEQKNEQLVN
jgi:hypothetical protein